MSATFDPGISEWGNLAGQGPSFPTEYIGRKRNTQGSDTSQYLQEKKENLDSPSSGERNGKSPNRNGVIGCVRFHSGVVGPSAVEAQIRGEVNKSPASQTVWKVRPKRVIAL